MIAMATARNSRAPSAAARKRPAKKAAAKKAAAKKAAPRKASSDDQRQRADSRSGSADADSSSANGRAPRSLRSIAVAAAGELAAMIGQQAEGIVGIEKHDDGWRVQVEVIETRRIPDTTDILAIYEVDVEADGTVSGYRRRNRYVRGRFED
jgi:hypothetical protein